MATASISQGAIFRRIERRKSRCLRVRTALDRLGIAGCAHARGGALHVRDEAGTTGDAGAHAWFAAAVTGKRAKELLASAPSAFYRRRLQKVLGAGRADE